MIVMYNAHDTLSKQLKPYRAYRIRAYQLVRLLYFFFPLTYHVSASF